MIKKYLPQIFTILLIVFSVGGYGQKDKEVYHTVLEIFEKGAELYANENYTAAYDKFMEVNLNDTAFIDSRLNALQCLQMEDRFDTIINVCKDVLAISKYNPSRQSFINSLGHAYIQKQKFDEAADVLDAGLKEFPRNYLMHYNRSVIYCEQENYTEGVKELQTSIRYNPHYFASHYKLGLLCYQAGLITKAALALNMAIYLDAASEKAVNIIALLEKVYSGEKSDKPIASIEFREEEEFDEIDLLIKNKIAENNKYKVKIKLGYTFLKQNHLLFESIDYDENSNGFWNQNYLRFFKQIFKDGQFANFSYYQCLSIDNQSTQDVLLKNKSKIKDFITYSAGLFVDYMSERTVWENGAYVKNKLVQEGTYGFDKEMTVVNDKAVGPYIGYNGKGLKVNEGQFNANGNLDGEWKYYDDEGRLEVVTMFKDGELDGKRTNYYTNGSRQTQMTVKNGNLVDTLYRFYSCNLLYSKETLNDESKREGPTTYYFKSGKVMSTMNYANGELNGDHTSYYSNGQVKAKYTYDNGKLVGSYKSYHRNGAIEQEGQYENDLQVGHWKIYHDNGQLEEEGDFKEGYRVGIWKALGPNGKLSSETNYGETGKKTGVYKEYDLDGNLILELTYKGEEIISYKTMDKTGKVLSEGTKEKKELEYKGYHLNGELSVSGNYYKDKRVGNWKYYNQYGVLKKEINYNDEGKLEGTSKWYFDNGQVETIKKFKDDKLHGYFVDYYRNGNIFKHGWFNEGETIGEWRYYYRNGTLKTTKYFLEDEVHGEVLTYDEKGRLAEISTYYYGDFEKIATYDTTEKLIEEYPLKNGYGVFDYKDMNGKIIKHITYVGGDATGEIISYHANGKISSKGMADEDNLVGEWNWYNREGVLITTGNYDNGVRDGEWKWFYDNGKLEVKQTYVKGEIDGTQTRYYENGKVEAEKNYRNGERHGKSTYYDPSGEIQLMRYYEDGVMIGYTYLGKDGKEVEMIKFDNQNGVIEAYFKSGTKSYHSEYKDGFNQGETIYYHANGKPAQVRMYDKDQYNGLVAEYSNTGKPLVEENYVDGDLQGERKEYYANGKSKKTEYYILGELYGWQTDFSQDGKVTRKVYFYDGREIK